MSDVEQVVGPVALGPRSRAAHRTLGVDAVRLTGGPWARWQAVNREVSIPTGIDRLEEAGNFANLRLVTGEATGDYRGPLFMDSDLYKTLEAVGWDAGRAADATYDAFARDLAGLLERAQSPDGYLNSWVQATRPESRYATLAHSHELYCAGHLIQAAVAAARGMGDDRPLAVARRFADHLVTEFGADPAKGLDGHPEIETALVELYRLTGEAAYLDLARGFVDARGHGRIDATGRGSAYFQDHAPVREADTFVGHAVRALYLDAGVVDLYLETGDASLLECSLRRWHDMVATKTYLTGAVGSRHAHESFGDRYELPPDRAYNETCAAIASVQWNWRLLLATGHGRHADLIERTLYNAFAASTSTDGQRYFYVNPLQRRPDHLEGERVGDGRRHAWYDCACCPPNIMRLVASLGHYLATVSGAGAGDAGSAAADTLHLHQYAPAGIRAPLAGGEVALAIETDYPWSGTVRVRVDDCPEGARWGLALRVPAWSRTTALEVAGSARSAEPDQLGYVTVRRAWRPGDTVTLRLDMAPRLVFPHQRIDAVRGSVAVERGPLVYCFEQADQAEGVDVEELALPADADLTVTTHDSHPDLGTTVQVHTDASVIRQPVDGLPYSDRPASALASTRPATATAVPYFQWDNRDGRAMRVWLPVAPPREAADPAEGERGRRRGEEATG